MTEEQKKALLRYEELKIQAKEIDAELEELKPILVKAIPVDKEIKARYGVFVLKARPKWEYSIPTQAVEKDLRETKKREEAEGIAKEIPGKPYPEYRENKE